MDDVSLRPVWLRGWRFLALISGVFALLSAFVLTWWYFDDSDLRAVKERARSLGIPVTWTDVGRVVTSGERLVIWKEIAALADYPSLHSYADEKKPQTQRAAFAPITPELRAHHAAFDHEKIARFLSQLDRLGTEPLVFNKSTSTRDGYRPEINQYKRLMNLLRERILLASAEDVGRECRRMLGLVSTFEATTYVYHLIRLNHFSETLRTIAERLTDVKQRDPEMASTIAKLGDQIGAGTDKALVGEFLLLLDLVENSPSFAECQQFGALGDASWDNVMTPWMLRTGRRHVLDTQIDWLLYLRTDPDVRTALRRGAELQMAPYLNWNMNTRLDRFLLNQLQLWPASIHRGQLFARLLVAELRGTPWPIDDFDPLHQRLRPILRDGEIMGAYSVGNDGIDDGGEKDDRYFPLYGPRTAPKATP